MKKLVYENYDALSKAAAEIIMNEINGSQNPVLGLPTGGTPVGMYAWLTKFYQEKKVDFANVTTFNLDEYLGLDKNHEQSYYTFMNTNLYSKVNLVPENINIPDGNAADIEQEAQSYDQKIRDKGGIDLMVLGIGPNGHIGFNEPDDYLIAPTHTVTLTETTIKANARFFDSEADVPKKAITMGVGSIMKAKRILMLISGQNKKEIAKKLFSDKITTQNPASLLLLHADVTVLIDKDADQD